MFEGPIAVLHLPSTDIGTLSTHTCHSRELLLRLSSIVRSLAFSLLPNLFSASVAGWREGHRLVVCRHVEGRIYRKCLGDLVRDVAVVQRGRRNSRIPFRHIYESIMSSIGRCLDSRVLPIGGHLFKAHLEKNLPEFMAYFVHC